MATIKSFTDLEQSKKLAKILPIESADMYYPWYIEEDRDNIKSGHRISIPSVGNFIHKVNILPCWSLSALMKILHRNEEDIVSLSYGGYKDGEYILNWCLDYEFQDGDYKKTFANNPVDACYDMIIHLHELKML